MSNHPVFYSALLLPSLIASLITGGITYSRHSYGSSSTDSSKSSSSSNTYNSTHPASPPNGPHGGKILKLPKGNAELKVDASNKKIHIYLPKNPRQDPPGINVILRDEDNRTFSIDLKKLEQLHNEPGQPIHYQGDLNPSQQSYMGVQVSIPFSKDEPTVVEDQHFSP